MKKREILPLSIYEFDVPEDLVATTLALADTEKYYDSGTGHRTETYLHKNRKYNDVFSWVHESLEEVRVDQGYTCDALKVSLSWLNRWETGRWAPKHTHANSFVSGIIYLTNNDSRTWFSVDSLWDTGAGVIGMGGEEQIIHKEPSTSGKMLVFPSNLAHSVDENMSPHLRYTLTFNAFPSGNVYYSNHAQINLNVL